MAVNSDTAAADIIKTHQQIDQCCFAGSGLSYDRHLAAGFDMQIDIFHQRLLRIISKRYMFEIDFPFFEVQHIFIAVIALFFQIHDRKDTFTAGHRALQLCHDTGDFRKRLRKQIRVDQKSGNVTDRDLGEKGKQGTDRTDDGIRCIHDKARARIRQRTVKLRFYTGGIQLLIIRFKLPLSIFFISVCFNGPNAAEHFFAVSVQLSENIGLLIEITVGPQRNDTGNQISKRSGNDDNGCHDEVDLQHEHQGQHNGCHTAEHCR